MKRMFFYLFSKVGKRSLCCIVVAFLAAFKLCDAQPHAPVEWSEARWIGLDSSGVAVQQVVPLGDTLVFSGYGANWSAHTARSYDNGESHSEWQPMTIGHSGNDVIQLSGSGNRAMACVYDYHPQNPIQPSLSISTDAGTTWGPLREGGTGSAMFGFMSGEFAWRLRVGTPFEDTYVIRAYRSLDRGDNWLLGIVMEESDSLTLGFSSIAATASNTIALAWDVVSLADRTMRYAVGLDYGDSWEPFEVFPDQPYGEVLSDFSLAGDTCSETAVALSVWGNGQLFGPLTPWITRTVDGGLTWETPVALTDSATVRFGTNPTIFCNGKLWGFVWPDVREGDPLRVLYWRFSANHGRNWYPEQTVIPQTQGVFSTWGHFVEDEVRIYWQERTNDAGDQDIRTATGILTADTILPAITETSRPPDTIAVGDTVHFEIDVTDNDTLSRVDFGILNESGFLYEAGMDTIAYGEYKLSFIVPETGRYSFWYEAEDYWENERVLPLDEEFLFVTDDYIDAVEEGPKQVLDYRVSVFPNPSNNWPTLRLGADWWRHSDIRLVVYNVLGQIVLDKQLRRGDITSQGLPLVRLLNSSQMATGIYIAQVTSRIERSTAKFIILK